MFMIRAIAISLLLIVSWSQAVDFDFQGTLNPTLFPQSNLSVQVEANEGEQPQNQTEEVEASAIVEVENQRDPFCAAFDREFNCLRCSFRYYLNEGRCAPVSNQCRTWSTVTGLCLTCYDGFRLNMGACVLGAPNCERYLEATCIECSSGYELIGERCFREVDAPTQGSLEEESEEIPDFCQFYSEQPKGLQELRVCLKCRAEYRLVEGVCYFVDRIENCAASNGVLSDGTVTENQCLRCQPGFRKLSDRECAQIPPSETPNLPAEFLVESVSSADNSVFGQRAIALNNQLKSLHPSETVRCYNISFVNWAYQPRESCRPTQCSDNCLSELPVALRTVGNSRGRHFYFSYHQEADPEIADYFLWPSTNYPTQYSAPSDSRNDLLRAQKHCDGSWSFLTKNGRYISGASIYAEELSCAEKWTFIRSRDGNGFFLRNNWNHGWLSFNGCDWHISYHWRSKVLLENWG